MLDTQPLWSVVATVDEPPQLVQAFVAWHLALGADQIHLYFDRPDDPAMDLFVHLSRVIVTACDADHWQRVCTARPNRHQIRQVQNARNAYSRTTSSWLLHCDADEFIWSANPVSRVLADVDHAVDAVAVPVAERVYLAGEKTDTFLDGVFRRPFPKEKRAGRRIFGPEYDLTHRGLTGHAIGKAFVRTDRRLNMSIHRPARRDGGSALTLAHADRNAMELLHVDGLTPQYWLYKLARKAEAVANHDGMPPSEHRGRQIEALIAHPNAKRALHDVLKSVDTALQAKLAARDLLVQPPFDVSGPLARYFPDQVVDLSPAAIDRWLAENKAAVLSFLHE